MTLSGTVERVIYKSADTGYTVLELDCAEGGVVAVGTMPMVAEGEQVQLEGEYVTHKSYGRQFAVSAFTSSLPADAAAVLRFLSSGIVKGVGPKTAKLITEKFGARALDVIENDWRQLTQLRGISPQKAEAISESLSRTVGVKSILLYFQQFGLTPSVAYRIYKQWGVKAYDILRADPYMLCRIPGMGFEKADALAAKMGCDPGGENRVRAGVEYVLSYNLYNGGHTFLPRGKLCAIASQLLGVDYESVSGSISGMCDDEALIYEPSIGNTDGVYLPWVHKCEQNVAERAALAAKLRYEPDSDTDKLIRAGEKELGIVFADRQRRAIRTAWGSHMMILSGGPGTGKTTTLNGIINLFERRGVSYAIAAPTGRAARRVTELTGREARTLHRLLEYRPDGEEYSFGRNYSNPLKYGAVIVDEASMVDLPLFAALLDALPVSSRLILVGDSAQLPPVGPGNVFGDLSESGAVPLIELNEIFRQARTSLIVTNAHRILSGQMPDEYDRDGDFFFIRSEDSARTAALTADLYMRRLPEAYGYDPVRDIQILSATRKGECGTVSLNRIIGSAVNPEHKGQKSVTFRGTVFREGDKVMQIRNNYDAEVQKDSGETDSGIFNGDIGIVRSAEPREGTLNVAFEDRLVGYTPDMLPDLEHAYAITVHKSQGSEFKAVILVLDEGSELLFTRNLLYTAVTRAKELLVVVGRPSKLSFMVRNARGGKRYSGLKPALRRAMGEEAGHAL